MNIFRKVFINPSKSRFLYCQITCSKFQNDIENVNTKNIPASTKANKKIHLPSSKHAKEVKVQNLDSELRNNTTLQPS